MEYKEGKGGVAIIWKKNLSGISEYKDIISDRVCGVWVQNAKGANLSIFSVYLPSKGSPENFNSSIDDLADIIDSREIGSLSIVCGDMNADIGNLSGGRNPRVATQRGCEFYNFTESYNLFPTNLMSKAEGPIDTFYGPNGSSMIDYILIPNEMCSLIDSCGVSTYDPLNCSDHVPVYIYI